MIEFFPGEATTAWPLGLSALALVLVCFWRTSWPKAKIAVWWVALTLCLAALNIGANILRAGTTSYEDGRRVYSYAHHDVHEKSMWAQMALFGMQAVLLAGVWTMSLGHPAFGRPQFPSSPDARTLTKKAIGRDQTSELSDEFGRWQRISVLLVCGFVPGAFCFWRIVYKMHDARYLLPAAIYHFVYAMTWYVASRPLAHLWSRWHNYRLAAIAALGHEAQVHVNANKRKAATARLETLMAALDKLQPLPHNTAVIVILSALAALLAPFYEVFAK